MANEEPAHLVGTLKTCTLCGLQGMHKFQYCNNRSESQPRYCCLECGHQFTHGGSIYRKKNRKKVKVRLPPPPRSPIAPPLRAPTPSPPRASTPPPTRVRTPSRPREPSAADHDRVPTRMAANAARQAEKAEEAGAGQSSGSLGAGVVTGIGVTTRSMARTPPRPYFPSEADHDRARKRMARDAVRWAQDEAGGSGEPADPHGERVVMGIRDHTTGPSGVVLVPPRKLMYLVKIKIPGEQDIVRCEMMDLKSGIPDDCYLAHRLSIQVKEIRDRVAASNFQNRAAV